jgi:hypothetical protein
MEGKSTYFPSMDAARVDALYLRKPESRRQQLKAALQ